ncbi:MBL fold metallo-hydrolase [Desulfogranum mediterraneum]|uniref:MBL fold metallo-hydrolase n=1 Tax=Desulfogranum mediterraneum TaxID=160661 RepID=UPI0004092086|nr:MBL fold metallo-hydrolase [Desulfogranum mediterraneum]
MSVKSGFPPATPSRPLESASGAELTTGSPTEGQPEIDGAMKSMSLGEHLALYWDFFFVKGEKVPAMPLPQERLRTAELLSAQADTLKAAWLGHSTLLINLDGFTLLTDPVFEHKVSPLGPTRFNRELPLDPLELPEVDVVIISHNHYDHLNRQSIRQLKDRVGCFVVPEGVGPLLARWGVAAERIRELNWWQEFQAHPELTIAATPAQHFSGRGIWDRNQSLWASWVIKTPRHAVFFSGDSGYFPGFKEIGNHYGPFDLAFLECGAYDHRWSRVHMLPEETVQAFIDLRGRVLQPIHWATFNLALHPWYEPVERLTAAAWAERIQLSLPTMGQVVDYDQPLAEELWWLPLLREGGS